MGFIGWGLMPPFMEASDHGDGGRYTPLDAAIDNEGRFSKMLPVEVPTGYSKPGRKQFCVSIESRMGHSGLYQPEEEKKRG